MQKFFRVILWIGCSIQISLGICWIVMNFPHFQNFEESAFYLEISKNLICDEYEGILYPLLILPARGIEKIFPIPYYCILYLLQLGVALVAGYLFLQSVGIKDRKRLVWGSLVLLTFPMVMQCHLAVLPQSLVSSFLLLELAACLQAMKREHCFHSTVFASGLLCWMITALLQPEYLYLGAIPIALLFGYRTVRGWKNHKKSILHSLLLVMAFAGMIVGLHSLTQVEGYYGRTCQSLNLHLAGRCVWRYVHVDYEYWPEDAKGLFTPELARSADLYADNVERVVGRTLEDALGVERAKEVLGEIAKHAWTYHRQNIVHDAAWDAVGYTFPPLVVQRQFEGKANDSYSAHNYDMMRMQSPVLTEAVFHYGCWWFVPGLVVAGVLQVLQMFWEKKGFWNGEKVIILLGWMLTVVAVVLYYTLQGAGMMDYKKSIVVILLWLTWMLRMEAGKNSKEESIC